MKYSSSLGVTSVASRARDVRTALEGQEGGGGRPAFTHEYTRVLTRDQSGAGGSGELVMRGGLVKRTSGTKVASP